MRDADFIIEAIKDAMTALYEAESKYLVNGKMVGKFTDERNALRKAAEMVKQRMK